MLESMSLLYYILQFVADGVFKAELNEFLTRELAEDGYSGVEVRVTPQSFNDTLSKETVVAFCDLGVLRLISLSRLAE